MNKLTNEEVARVFAMYLGQGIKFEEQDYNQTGEQYLTSVQLAGCGTTNEREWDCISSPIYLLLTPIQKITDEHAKGVAALALFYNRNDDVTIGKGIALQLAGYAGHESRWINSWQIIQYLIKNGYAVPLFFGLNHWANHKTAIELKIASEI